MTKRIQDYFYADDYGRMHLMIPESPTTKYFSAAISQFLEQSGHGSQADLARRARVSTSYLNDLLSGRKPYWPDNIKERIAQVCGYSVAELLEIGEHYVKDGVFYPHARHVTDTASRSVERLAKIFQLAAKDVGVGMWHMIFTAESVHGILGQIADEYRSGAISDARMYADAIKFCKAILAG